MTLNLRMWGNFHFNIHAIYSWLGRTVVLGITYLKVLGSNTRFHTATTL